ncbi:hypothetical protein CBM2586_B90209 [Cupriavidus phytorum]|uniref:Uncharacterized protein n=1 Tax=Cupriavidus taiwanensis TaxID=164546 RepID=A0A976FS18_9BURK|nr:hypothetical protein CBM2586_B90209 [Cupriavidus taiwanensis]
MENVSAHRPYPVNPALIDAHQMFGYQFCGSSSHILLSD